MSWYCNTLMNSSTCHQGLLLKLSCAAFWQPYDPDPAAAQAASLGHEPTGSVLSKNIKACFTVLLDHLRERGYSEENRPSTPPARAKYISYYKSEREREGRSWIMYDFFDFFLQTVGLCINTLSAGPEQPKEEGRKVCVLLFKDYGLCKNPSEKRC